MRHDAVFTAVIFDRDRAGLVGLSANAGDEEREDHLVSRKSEPAVWVELQLKQPGLR